MLRTARRCLNTWSPLATAFNAKPGSNFTVSFGHKETGLFSIPELENATGFQELEDRAIARSNKLIDEATKSDTRSRKMVEIFDELSDTLCQVADMAEFVRIAHPSADYSKAAENACITISGIVEKLNTNFQLYNSLSNVLKNGDIVKTSEIDNHVANLFLFDFEQCGIHLPEKQRFQVVQLNDFILQCGQKFMAGALEPRVTDMKALPPSVQNNFTNDGTNVVVGGLNSDSSDALVRELAYKIFLFPDAKQEELLQDLLNSRHDLAHICGFPSYAHRAVRGSTVETPQFVNDFLNLMTDELRNRAQNEYDQLQKIKNCDSQAQQPIMPWDTAYLTNKARKSWLGSSNEKFAPYFSLGACMEGLNLLTQALYGVRLENQPMLSGEAWSSYVHKLAVIDENEELLGHIYCDFFDRRNKPMQDCHFTIRGGRQLPDGSYQNPVVVLMLTLPSPSKSAPSLLSPSLVDNLFHEMGHALHSMLGRTKYQHVTGTRCSTDFAEVPSVLMEYFSSDPRVISLFAKHYETGESMPQEMVHQLYTSKSLFPSSEMQSQVFYSMLDQVYHSGKCKTSTTSILEQIQNQYYGLPYVPNTAWQLRFSHLVGYGAKYYSYLVSRAIASWIWHTYFEADPLSRSSGERYRNECLAHGGGKPPSKLVADFLNRKSSPENFVKSLIHEIDKRTEYLQTQKSCKSV
ncbi:mitochondrial intermediate peptidase [Copidosoma floridanum]|uniref:mitochondrial intermediate peptidase n=1 Tax=Copidosoma floridanum TaxID=29053 RepID=UPI0006C96FB3|nr:mitochondrial intermediate peptidase [Copidosoma floridanum]XP_014219723.1 mitochondrial intermediate peptidase [Copidosoma floridanum]